MAYRSVSVKTKFDAVMDYFKGVKPAEIESARMVDRNSLRIWVRRAEEAIVDALDTRPGRPRKEPGASQRTEPSSQLSQDVPEPVVLSAPKMRILGTCPVCGSTRIVKNGRCPKGGKGTPLERVQRYICRDCNSNLYGSKKNSTDREPDLGLRTSRNRSV